MSCSEVTKMACHRGRSSINCQIYEKLLKPSAKKVLKKKSFAQLLLKTMRVA